MNPYDHALSSARIHGGDWRDTHAVHAWFDATKATYCHFAHRALRHHREGVEVMSTRFGAHLANSAGGTIDTAALGRQHMLEDCAHEPDAADWLVDYDAPEWMPAETPDAEALARRAASRFGGRIEDHLPLHAWFLETASWADGPAHLLFRHHAFGAFEAEERFGPAIAWDGGAIATRVAAETHIRHVLGRVPPAHAWLKRVRGQRWMLRAAQPRGLDFDTGTAKIPMAA